MVVLCFLNYGESMDVAFLIVVCILTKLLAIKVTRNLSGTSFEEREDLCLYTEMGVQSIAGVYHVKTRC